MHVVIGQVMHDNSQPLRRAVQEIARVMGCSSIQTSLMIMVSDLAVAVALLSTNVAL